MSWEVPAGGSGSANFTNTGLGYDGTNLLIGDFDNGRIVKTTLAGAYVSEIVLASSPASSVQGVAYDTSDGTYWVCHYGVSAGTIRQYNASGTLLNTITPGVGTPGPNGCVYDAVNDRILTIWPDNVVRGYSCATLSATPVETITLSGYSGTSADGIALDPSSPSTRLWVALDGSVEAAPAYLNEINRASGAMVSAVVIPSSCESLVYAGSDLYVCHDQGFHLSVTNGNRVWELSPATGNEVSGQSAQAAGGSFTLATASGSQVVSGLGFVPKVVFVFGMFNGAGATAGDLLGVADSQCRQWAMCSRNNDAAALTAADKAWDSTLFIASTDGAGAYSERAAFGSVTHDGFALNVTTTGSTRRLHYLAFGGDDVNAYVGKFDLTTGTGTQAVTGVPFQPKCVLFSLSLSNVTEGVVSTESRFAIGAMTSAAQWSMSAAGIDNSATSDEQGVSRTDAALVRITNSLTTSTLAAYSSMDAGGFTVNKSTGPGVNVRCGFVALGGGAQYALGSFNQPTSTGSQAVTGTGFTPLAELFVSAGRVSSTSVTAHARTMIGAAVSSSNRRSYATTAQDAVNPSNSARDMSESAALIACTDGGTPTRQATADFVSQDSNGFTINWTTADATARENLYLAVGSGSVITAATITPAAGTSTASTLVTSSIAAATITAAAGVATTSTLASGSATSAAITAAAGTSTTGTLAGSATAASAITSATGAATTSTLTASAASVAALTAAAGVTTTSTLTGSGVAAATITQATGAATTSTLTGAALTPGLAGMTPATGVATTSTMVGASTAAAALTAATGTATTSTVAGASTAAATMTPAAGAATASTMASGSSTIVSATMTPASGAATASTFAASAVAASVCIAAAGAAAEQTMAASAMAVAAITAAAGVATCSTLVDANAIVGASAWWRYDVPVNDMRYAVPVHNLRYDVDTENLT